MFPQCPSKTVDDLNDQVARNVQNAFKQKYVTRNALYRIAYRFYRKSRFGNETIVKKEFPCYLLDKTTHLMNKISYLNGIFPDAKFIFILRDVYSQTNSMAKHLQILAKKNRWHIQYPNIKGECWRFIPVTEGRNTNGKPVESYHFSDIPLYWIEHNASALKFLDTLSKNRKIYISYEQLVNDLNTVIDRLESFLEIKRMNRKIVTRQINYHTNDPLNQWKTELSEEQLTIINKVIDANSNDYEFILSRLRNS